jgi:hypothetical protein
LALEAQVVRLLLWRVAIQESQVELRLLVVTYLPMAGALAELVLVLLQLVVMAEMVVAVVEVVALEPTLRYQILLPVGVFQAQLTGETQQLMRVI